MFLDSIEEKFEAEEVFFFPLLMQHVMYKSLLYGEYGLVCIARVSFAVLSL